MLSFLHQTHLVRQFPSVIHKCPSTPFFFSTPDYTKHIPSSGYELIISLSRMLFTLSSIARTSTPPSSSGSNVFPFHRGLWRKLCKKSFPHSSPKGSKNTLSPCLNTANWNYLFINSWLNSPLSSTLGLLTATVFCACNNVWYIVKIVFVKRMSYACMYIINYMQFIILL